MSDKKKEAVTISSSQVSDLIESTDKLAIRLAHHDELIARHRETHRKGLEARDQILERIKPLEILEMVRKVWGRGEIAPTAAGGILTYSYRTPIQERYPVTHTPIKWSYPLGNTAVGGDLSGGDTGKWLSCELAVQQEVSVKFGNRENPRPTEEEKKELFVDYTKSELNWRIPRRIWSRPDNLVIHVTTPNELLPVHKGGSWFTRSHMMAYFDLTSSQKEIMAYLMEKLDTQALDEKLPPQVESIELAKIEELRRRGLFIEGMFVRAHISTSANR